MLSIRTSWRTCSQARSSWWKKPKYSGSQYRTTTSFQSRICGQNSAKMQSSCNTFLINIQLGRVHLGSTFLTFWIRSTLSISSRYCSMQIRKGWLQTPQTIRGTQSIYPNSGRRSWRLCHTYHVSRYASIFILTIPKKYRKKWQNTPSFEAGLQKNW